MPWVGVCYLGKVFGEGVWPGLVGQKIGRDSPGADRDRGQAPGSQCFLESCEGICRCECPSQEVFRWASAVIRRTPSVLSTRQDGVGCQ